MSNRLGGKQGTAYVGTNAIQPPDYKFSDRDPTQYDVNNVTLGDFWLNQTDKSLWVLVSLAGTPGSKGSLATWVSLANDATGALSTLTGDTGGLVAGDSNANINLVGDGIGIVITGDPVTHTLTASLVGGGGGEAAQEFPTDSGTALPTVGVLEIKADTAGVNSGSTVSFSAFTNVVTLNVTDANDNTIIGRASGNSTIAGGDNTILGEGSGFSLTSGSDNTIIGGTAGTGLTSGSDNILIGSGSGASLTTSNSSNTIIGGLGFAGATEFVVITAGAEGTPILHNYPGVNASTTNGGNTFVGANSGNFTLAGAAGNASNNALGTGSLASLTTGARNNAVGSFSLNLLTTGANNTVLGHEAGFDSLGATGLVTGEYNTLIGYAAGNAYTGAESSNIILGGSTGVIGESNTLRIGDGTGVGTEELNRAFISGIVGITPDTADGVPVFIGSDGQLGTVGDGGTTFVSTLTGNSGGAVGPLAGNIDIIGDGVTATVVGNPGTNTLTITVLGGGGGGGASVFNADSGSAIEAGGIVEVITNNATQDAGASVLFTGSGNTLVLSVSDADDNTLIGEASGNGTLTGSKNVALGTLTANAITSGINNSMLGYGAGTALTSGGYNTLLGYLAGSGYVSTEASNIAINAVGTATDANTLRIGAATGAGLAELNRAFIQGIRGITPDAANGIPVFISSTGQLGTVGSGGTTMVQTVTGNSGGAVGPAAGNINIVGDGVTATVVGNPGTNTLTISALGGGGGDLTVLAGDTGSATPTAGTINIITDNAAQEAGSTVLFTGSGSTIQLQVTDNDSNTLIGGETGNATLSGTENTALGTLCATNLTTGSSNILLGIQAGSLITTGSGNILCGNADTATMLRGTTTSTGLYGFGSNGSVFLHNFGGSASGNTFVGYGSAGNFNAGQQASTRNNTACGLNTLAAITSATNNVAIGASAGAMTTGSNNTLLGVSAGSSYTTSESSNICIGSGTSGTVTESNAIRIGAGTGTGTGQANKTFIAGIRGITTGISNAVPVVIDSAGQLGTAGGGASVTSLTGDTGGPVSASLGNIDILGDGANIAVDGSPGTNTLTITAIGAAAGDPSFFAYLTNTVANVTGNGDVYQIIYDTLPYNLGGSFNLGTSVFTAPATGLYNFSCGIYCNLTLSIIKPVTMKLVTTNNTFVLIAEQAPASSSTSIVRAYVATGNNFYTNMTSGDTAFITIEAGTPPNTKNVAIQGSLGDGAPVSPVGIISFFSGSIVSIP